MRETLRLARETRPSGTGIRVAALVVSGDSVLASSVGIGADPISDALLLAAGSEEDSVLVVNAWCRRQSPLTEALQAAGVSRIIAGLVEPGAEPPSPSGVGVTTDVLLEECWSAAAGALVAKVHARPLVTAKFATSIDGRIATRTGASKWITGSSARRRGHELRRESGAIIVGAGTVRSDNPRLTTRLEDEPGARNPLRVVLSSQPALPEGSWLLETAEAGTLVFHAETSAPGEHLLRASGVETILAPGYGGRVDPHAVLIELHRRGINRVLLEGGGDLIGTFADAGLIDQVVHFQAPLLIGGAGAKSCLAGDGVSELTQARRGIRSRAEACGTDLEITTDFLKELVPQPAEASTG